MDQRSFAAGLLASVALGAMFAANPARAQENAPTTDAPPAAAASPADGSVRSGAAPIEDIIVIARRREERLQDVPAAVTAFGGDALHEQQIGTAIDLQMAVPSLDVGGSNTSFSHASANYAIRGIGQGLAGGPTVTSYFAEAPFGPTGPSMPFFDISSVQVLKGPQGTLFGRATVAGAVLVQPNVPTADAFYGSVHAKLGNLGRSDADLMINVPIVSDAIALRVALNRTHRNGYVRNLSTGQKQDEDDSRSARIGLLIEPTDWFSNTSFFNYYKFDGTSAGRVVVAANLGLPTFNLPAASFTSVCAQAVSFGFATNVASCQAERVATLANIRAALADEIDRTRQGGDALRTVTSGSLYPNTESVERRDFVNTMVLKLPDIGPMTLTAKDILSYQQSRSLVSANVSGTPYDIVASAFGPSSRAQYVDGRIVADMGRFTPLFTNEFQLSGTLYGDALTWIAGYYYQKQSVAPTLEGSPNLSIAAAGVLRPNLGPSSQNLMLSGHDRERAFFGQITADLSFLGLKNVHFTAGYRKTKADSIKTTAAPVFTYPSGLVSSGAVSTTTASSSGPGYTFSLDWKATPDLLLYVARRKGYKPGGVNTFANASSLPGFIPVYAPETIVDTEVGVKWDFSAGGVRGRMNLAAFRDNYRDIQRGFNLLNADSQNVGFTANVAAARIQGIEAETSFSFGSRWTLLTSYSLIDAKYTRWFGADPIGAAPAGTNIDLSNNPFANAPRNKGSVTLQYELPVSDSLGELRASMMLFGQSRTWLNDNAQRYLEVYSDNPNVILAAKSLKDAISNPGFVAVNARLDWSHVGGYEPLDASLFVRNLTNRIWAYHGGTALNTTGEIQKLYSEPRTFGIELTYRFGNR